MYRVIRIKTVLLVSKFYISTCFVIGLTELNLNCHWLALHPNGVEFCQQVNKSKTNSSVMYSASYQSELLSEA